MLEKGTQSVYLAWLGDKASVKQKMQLLRNLLYHFSEDEVRWKEKHRHKKGVHLCVLEGGACATDSA